MKINVAQPVRLITNNCVHHRKTVDDDHIHKLPYNMIDYYTLLKHSQITCTLIYINEQKCIVVCTKYQI